jgi:hypothetical protein
MQVPKNKTIYRGGRRFVEGEIIPPHLLLPEDIPVYKEEKPATKSRRGRPRKSTGRKPERNIY